MKVGDQVEFLGFGTDDPYTRLRVGTKGVIRLIDDVGTIHVDWADGSTLGLVTRPLAQHDHPSFKPDRFKVVSDATQDA